MWKKGAPDDYGILYISKIFKYKGKWNHNIFIKYFYLVKTILFILYFLAKLKIDKKTLMLLIILIFAIHY